MTALDAAGQALLIIMDPFRLMMVVAGVIMGLSLGVIPGIGGLVGIALLMPFTYSMDPFAAFALLLGMIACTNTSDTLPAVLFGVPGSAAAQATVMDGHPMAKKGEAGRALAAAYSASLIGGVIGAIILGLTIPIIRPAILYIGSPELLALSMFGIAMVSLLAGNAPLRGLVAAGIGILLSMVGGDPQTGTLRWTLGGNLYLWEGLPLVPMILGMFALPELADLYIKRTAISREKKYNTTAGMLQGIKDTLQNWKLAFRCSALGCLLGAIPGVGGSVIDWLAYGHALQTEKGARKTFGTGDVRGVIAPECANNSDTAGSLVPTIAFGIPGSASMAVLLGAFMVQGLVPGPSMVTTHLDVTYSMVWSIAIANIVGTLLLFMFSGQFAKLALLRYTLVLPIIMCIVYVGAFQVTRSWGDLYALLIFSIIGWTMKQLKWPRPPLILGFVLGAIIERYMFISISRYETEWLTRPVVVILLMITVFTLFSPFIQDIRSQGGLRKVIRIFGKPKFRLEDLFHVFVIGLLIAMLLEATGWRFFAQLGPMIVGIGTLFFACLSLLNQVLRRGQPAAAAGGPEPAAAEADEGSQRIHLDLKTDMSELTIRTILTRAATFFGWLVGFMASFATIGMFLTIPLFIVGFMRIEGQEKWRIVTPFATIFTLFCFIIFDRWLLIQWPPTFLGTYLPMLRFIPGV